MTFDTTNFDNLFENLERFSPEMMNLTSMILLKIHKIMHPPPLPSLYLISTFNSCRKMSTNRMRSPTPFSTHADTKQISFSFKNHGLIKSELTFKLDLTKLGYQTIPNSIMSPQISHPIINRTLPHISQNLILVGPYNQDRT